MKRDRLRDGLVRVLIERPADSQVSARLAGQILERWDELIEREKAQAASEQPGTPGASERTAPRRSSKS